jgi:hypothetical protein
MHGKKHIQQRNVDSPDNVNDCPGYVIEVDPAAVNYKALSLYRAALRKVNIPNLIS